MLGKYENIDRRIKEPKLEPVDAIMLTLDAEDYLEKTLDATYREVPIKNLYVVDGGSKDKTIEILKKYPRMKIYIKPEIRTTGKGCEFLFSKVTTNWMLLVDCAKVPGVGWYDEMLKYQDKYDFYGSKRIVHYEFEKEDPTTTDISKRPLGAPWLIKKEAVRNYHVNDDYAWREVDILIRQTAEKNGYKYGAVPSAHHVCYITDGEKYKSDEGKQSFRMIFKEPELEITNLKNWEKRQENARKATVKYLDPESSPYLRNDGLFLSLMKLDMNWVKKTNMKWHNEIKEFKKKRYRKIKLAITMYKTYRFLTKKIEKMIDKVIENYKK